MSKRERIQSIVIVIMGIIIIVGSINYFKGNTITTESPNFFAVAKLKREQTRLLNKETLMEIINNDNITDDTKETAINSLINLTAIAEKEDATEFQLQAKGFSDAFVSIINNQVNVIINEVSLTEQEVAQAEDIVKRNTGVESNQIIISAVATDDQARFLLLQSKQLCS